VKDLLALVIDMANKFEPVHVVNIISAMADLGQGSLHVKFGNSSGFHVVELLLTRAINTMSYFRPGTISMLTYGLSELNILGAKEMAELLSSTAKQQLKLFTLQDFSTFLHALAKLKVEDHVKMLRLATIQIAAMADEVDSTQQIGNILWALATLKVVRRLP